MPIDAIRTVVDHPAPMAIRWGRGNGLGLFAARMKTPVEIRGVDPADLARPATVPGYVDPEVRVHGRRLWVPVEAIGPHGMGRGRATLDEALAHLTDPPRRDRTATEGGVIGLNNRPFRTPYGWELHHARAIQESGEIPRAAMDSVDQARSAASRALTAHVASHLLHDGTRLYARMPVPLISLADPTKPTTETLRGLHRPSLLNSRIGEGGRLPFGRETIPVIHTCMQVAGINLRIHTCILKLIKQIFYPRQWIFVLHHYRIKLSVVYA